MAEVIIQTLEIVDVEQAYRQAWRDRAGGVTDGAALQSRTFEVEGLQQATPVGDLRQLISGHLIGQAAQLAFKLADALRQVGRTNALVLQAALRLVDKALHRAAFLDHFAHHAGQAFQRVGTFDHIGIAAHAFMETAGLRAQLAKLAEHAVDQLLQRVASAVALAAQLGLLGARGAQQFVDRLDATGGQAFFDGQPHRIALALRPALVFCQVGQAGGQLDAQPTDHLEQMLTMLQDPVSSVTQAFDLAGRGLARSLRLNALDSLSDGGSQVAVAVFRWQGTRHRVSKRGNDARGFIHRTAA